MTPEWPDDLQTLLEAPSPAVLVTYRKDDRALATPVWFRWADDAFEMVIAKGDVKLRHLERRPECAVVIFETVPPFRGVELRGKPDLRETDVTPQRTAIASRYLGPDGGKRYAAARDPIAVLLRLAADSPRAWDLTAMLP